MRGCTAARFRAGCGVCVEGGRERAVGFLVMEKWDEHLNAGVESGISGGAEHVTREIER